MCFDRTQAMSFLRHREIYQSDEREERRARFNSHAPLIVLMSFQLAIPWRVALQQSSPPLHQLGMILAKEEHDGKSRFGGGAVRIVKTKTAGSKVLGTNREIQRGTTVAESKILR
jgi:hypothetical protein